MANPQDTHFAIRQESSSLLEQTGYWIPATVSINRQSAPPRSKLRISCIVEDRLYHGLRSECQIIPLTPRNWNTVIDYSNPDILLIESIWNTATGHWHIAQCQASPDYSTLLNIIRRAQQKSIPTVFWFTKGNAYHEHYRHFAGYFDYVFCADPEEANKLTREGIVAEVLLPCVQSSLYNLSPTNALSRASIIPILYDGWADIDRFSSELSLIKRLIPHGLKIMESRYQLFKRRKNILPEYKESILGCIPPRCRPAALRLAKSYITLSKTLSSVTTQQWMSLEAAACGLPVVHHGDLSTDDIRHEFVLERSSQEEFIDTLVALHDKDSNSSFDSIYPARKILENHTFNNRVRWLCKRIGISAGSFK